MGRGILNVWAAVVLPSVLPSVLSYAPAYGSLSATATISSHQLDTNSFEYSMTLTDTGTTPIGTFWFGWIPAYDLLPSPPTSITAPSGWTGTDAPDDFGVSSAQWVNTATPLQPGQSLGGFTFVTPDSPAVIGGTSSFFGLPVEQSYVYVGAPETDPGFAFVPATVTTPEPAAPALVALAAAAPLLARRRQPRRGDGRPRRRPAPVPSLLTPRRTSRC